MEKSAVCRDDDEIIVHRSLLAAAAYCARKHAGVDSQTYKALRDAALSKSKTEILR